jgi:hypothetical protein
MESAAGEHHTRVIELFEQGDLSARSRESRSTR